METNNLGQPTYKSVTDLYCSACNAVTCAGCPINEGINASRPTKRAMIEEEARAGDAFAGWRGRKGERMKLKTWHYAEGLSNHTVHFNGKSVCGRRGICTSNTKLVDCKICLKIIEKKYKKPVAV